MLSHLRLEGNKGIRTVISMIVRIRRGHSKEDIAAASGSDAPHPHRLLCLVRTSP